LYINHIQEINLKAYVYMYIYIHGPAESYFFNRRLNSLVDADE